MATGADISQQPLTLMERDGLQTTVNTSFEGNAVVPEGGSFLESPLIAKVAVEETSKEQETYQTESLSFQAEKETPENEKEIVEGTAAKENEAVDKTKKRAEKSEKNSEVVDNTETIPQTAKVEEPCLNIGEEESSREEKILEHVEEDLSRQASVEERPGSIEKEIHGSERNKDEGRKIDQSDELETSKEVSMCHSSLHQSQEAFRTADVAVNNIDSGVETETEALQENESEDNARGDEITSVDEKQIGEERFEGVEEKSESTSSFLDEKKVFDATKPIENIANEKDGTECHAVKEGSSVVKESLDIQNREEAVSKVGEHVQEKLPLITESRDCIQEESFEGGDKLEHDASLTCKEARQETINLSENMEDTIHVVNKTQEKLPIDSPSVTQTEEIEAQKVDESELHIVSETGLEEIVKKSPQQGGKTLTPEKTAEAGGIGGENVKDEMNPEEKVDGLIVKNEESKQSILEELATTEASIGESREIGENTVIAQASADDSRNTGKNTVLAAEDNVNDAVPITTLEHSEIAATTEASTQESRETGETTEIATEDNISDAVPIATAEHSAIAAEEKIRDAITTITPENSKEEASKHDNNQEDSSTLQDEPEKEEIENSLKIIPKEIDTTSSESSEAISTAKENPPTEIQEESSREKREGEPVDTRTIIDNVIPKAKDLPSKELDENIEGVEVEIQSKNSNDLHITHSLEQETIQAEDENLQNVSSFGPQEQFEEANGASEDLEKHVANAAEVIESTENILDLPSVEEATTTELSSKPSERDIKKLEEVHDLEPEEKLEIDDAGTKIEEEMQNKEEVHDIQTHKQATTSERTEEVITDEVCNAALVDEKVEQSIQAENLQEAETRLRNEIEDNCKNDIINDEAHDEPKVTGIGEVTDEESIKDNGAHLALEEVDEKIVETSQDAEKEADMSKGEEVEEKIMGEGNSEAILQESIKEAPVENFQHDEQNSGISSTEVSSKISAEFEAAKTIETKKNDGSHNSIPQTSPTKEQEYLQAESQKPAEEEINEVGSPNSGLAEVEENNPKETLKGREDLKQMSQVSETEENLEHSVDLLRAATEADVLRKMTDNTEEEAADIVENNMMKAEVVIEDVKEQIIDESNMKSITQEYVDQGPVNNLQTDQNNAETSNTEIFDESKTSGTDASIAHGTDQIAESPSTATLVKEVESVEREDIEKSDEESFKTADGTDHETNQNSEIPSATLEILQVKEAESLQTEHLAPAEASPVDKKHEDGSIKKDEDMENNILPEKIKKKSEETWNGEENLEQILPNNESKENPEQSVTVISAETETATFSKTAEHQDSMVEIPQHNTKEEEMTKEEDTDGQNIESNIKSISQECIEEYPVENLQHDEKNHEKSNIEIVEESQIAGGGESTAHELNQNDESPKSSLSIPSVKEEEILKDEVENVAPIDASIREKEEDQILEKAGEGNDSNPEIIDINENSKREILRVEEDLEQESQQKGETGEIEQSAVVMGAETEASTFIDETDDITGTKEVSSIQNIEKTVEQENKEESENIDVIEVKKGNLEEDLKLVAEASDISKNNEAEVDDLITGQREVEMLEKKFVLDTKQELKGKEAGENIEEETKNEDIKEVCQDTTIACSSEDTEKKIKAEEHTGTCISPQSTGDETDLIGKEDETEAKTENEICEELVISSVDEETKKPVSDEESNTDDQSAAGPTRVFVYEDDQSGTLPKQEVHEITQIVEEVEDIGNEGNESTTNFKVPLIREYKQNPVNLEKNHESTKMKLKEEAADLDSKSTEQNEEQDSVEKQEFETLKDKQEPNSSLYLMEASEEEAIIEERNESLVESPCSELVNTEEKLEETKPEVKDSSPVSVDGLTSETILKEGEPEDKIQIESFQLASQEKEPVTMDTEGTTDKIVDADAKSEDACNSGELKDHGIPAAAGKPEKIEHEMQAETPNVRSEDQKVETTIEKHLDKNFDDNLPDSRESELRDNEASKTTDKNTAVEENLETPGIPQGKELVVKEDASKVGEMDTERESTNEEARSYQFEDLNKEQELGDEKYMFEDKEILMTEEARDLVNQEEILENEDSIKPGDEALKSIESISTDREEAILEEKEPSEKYNSGMTESVEVEKAAYELEAGTNDQEQTLDAKHHEVLAEENHELTESDKKPEHVSETGTKDQTSEGIIETNCSKGIEIQNDESVEKISQEFQEVQQENEENPGSKLETDDHMKETQATDGTIKDVILTEEVHEEIKRADSNETIKSTKEEEKDIRELYATPAEDQVKESNLVATEYLKATDSGERTATMSSEFPRDPNTEEVAVAKEKEETKVDDDDNRISAAVSTTATAEELEETKDIIDKEDGCSDKISATTVVVIAAETGLKEAQLDDKPAQISNNDSNDTILHTTEAEASQQDKIGDGMALEEHFSNLASQLPTDDGKNVTNEMVAPENTDADDVQGSKMASDVAIELKDHGTDELHTSNIKEINDASEIIESPGAEGATEQEVAADQTLPEATSEQHEHGTPATAETSDGNIKDNEVMEDDLRTTEEISLQKKDSREPDISQSKPQSNEDIQNQPPKEVQEEEFGAPDDIKEEITEVSESVSNSNSQGSEVQKEDETTSDQTALGETSEEQNQTSSVALSSNKKDCKITTTIQNIEEHIKDVEVPVDHPQDSASPVTTEDTYLQKDDTKELEVVGLGVEHINTDIQKDSLNDVPVEEGQTLDEASKLQPQEYKDKIEDRKVVPESEEKTEITGALHDTYNVSSETSKEAFESASEFHSNKSSAETEETETMQKHPEVAVIDLVAEENQNEKTIDATEIIHDEVAGEFERTLNPRAETSEEAFKSVSETHRPEALAESEDTEIKENHPEVAASDMVVDENQNEITIDATEITYRSEKEKQQIMAEEEDANNCHPIPLGEETSQHEYEHKAEKRIGDDSTVKDIQNQELYKEVERIETHQDTERSIEHLHQDIVENKTIKESFPEAKNAHEAGSKTQLQNQNDETTFGNGTAEAVTINEEELDEEMSRKDGPTDPAKASKTTQDIHQGEKASETTTQNIEEYVKEEETAVDEHPQSSSAPKTTEDKSSQEEDTKELKVAGVEVELDTDLHKDSTDDVHEQEGRTPGIASASQPEEYEKDIKDAPAGDKMKEITREELVKSVSKVHGHEILTEPEDTEIQEKHPEAAVTDLASEENQSNKTREATEIIHDDFTNEEVTIRERQKIMEENGDAKTCYPITPGEEKTEGSHQICEQKAEESQGHKTPGEMQNEEVINQRTSEDLHQDAAENEMIKASLLDEAAVKNVEDIGTKLHHEKQSYETVSGCGGTEATAIEKEELDEEMSRKDGPTDPAEASKTTQDIYQGEKASETTTQNIEEYAKEEEIAVDEHPQSSSAPKTTEDKSLQEEDTKELKVAGLEVELDTDLHKDITDDVHEQEGRTPGIASASQPEEYENDIKDAPAGDKMKEITSEELVKSASKVHGHEILTEPEDTEIQEKHPEVAVTDLASEENQRYKTREETEIIHDEFTNEEVTTRKRQKIMEENGDAKTCYPITPGEEKTEGSHQICEQKAEESQGHKAPGEMQNEEVINQRTSKDLHQDAVENEMIKAILLDEAAVKNVEDIGTKLHLEKQSYETVSGCGGTEAAAIKKEELGIEMSQKEGPTGLGKANETTQEIHEVEKSSESNSEGQISNEAESLATTDRKKDVPQVLREPIAETKQSAEAGESQPGNAIGVINTQGLEHETDKGIDENNGKEIEAIMSAESAEVSLFDMMQRSTRERQVDKDLTEEKVEAIARERQVAKDLTEEKVETIASKDETKLETNKVKSDEENEEEEDKGEEHRQNDSGLDASVMVEASRDIVDAKVIIPHKKSHNILSGVGSKVKHSISKVKKAITGKSSHPKQHSPK